MKQNRVWLTAVFGAVLVLFSPAAKAKLITIDFESAHYSVVGTINLADPNANPVAITAINALVNGIDTTTIVPNPNPLLTHQLSLDDLWWYDNIGYSGNPHLDNDGLLFTAGLYEYNIYADPNIPAGSRPESTIDGYLIFRSLIGGGYNGIIEAGTLIATDPNQSRDLASDVPELSTWAMMLLGFAGIGLVAYRRTKKRSGTLSAA